MIQNNILAHRLNNLDKEKLTENITEETEAKSPVSSDSIDNIGYEVAKSNAFAIGSNIGYYLNIVVPFIFRSLVFGYSVNIIAATSWEFIPITIVGMGINLLTNLFNKKT